MRCKSKLCAKWLGDLSGNEAEHSHDAAPKLLIDHEFVDLWSHELRRLLAAQRGYLLHSSWKLEDVRIPVNTSDGMSLHDSIHALSEQGKGSYIRISDHWRAATYKELFRRFMDVENCQIQAVGPTLPYGSHHEKMTCFLSLERQSAIVSSADLNYGRLDSSAHDPKNASGYRRFHAEPTHEVAIVVEGSTAAAIAADFQYRWGKRANKVGTAGSRSRHDTTSVVQPDGLLETVLQHDQDDSTGPGCQVLFSSPNPGKSNFSKWRFRDRSRDMSVYTALLGAIRTSRDYIYIEDQFFWLPGNTDEEQEILDALCDAISRGVSVILAVTHPSANPRSKAVFNEALRTQGMLRLAQKAGENKRHGQFIAVAPKRVAVDGETTFFEVHSKVLLIDDTYAMIGSANFNTRSWTIDHEVAIAVVDSDPEGLPSLSRRRLWHHLVFGGDYHDSNAEVTLEQLLDLLSDGESCFFEKIETWKAPSAVVMAFSRSSRWVNRVREMRSD